MAVDKSAVLVGIDPATELEVWRRYLTFEANRENEYIKVVYSQFYLSNGVEIPMPSPRQSYLVINNPSGFDDWYNFTITAGMAGAALGANIIVPAINQTLRSLPIDVANNYVLTMPDPKEI